MHSAREAELERISAQAELGTQEGREQRTRGVVSEQCGRDEPVPAERTDPREMLTQEELAAVNEPAMRISDEVQGGWPRAVVAKQLAEKGQCGRDVTKAVLESLEADEELDIQTAGFTKCRFPVVAKRYAVRDGEVLHADLSSPKPIGE